MSEERSSEEICLYSKRQATLQPSPLNMILREDVRTTIYILKRPQYAIGQTTFCLAMTQPMTSIIDIYDNDWLHNKCRHLILFVQLIFSSVLGIWRTYIRYSSTTMLLGSLAKTSNLPVECT